jgi:kynurenine formamidase
LGQPGFIADRHASGRAWRHGWSTNMTTPQNPDFPASCDTDISRRRAVQAIAAGISIAAATPSLAQTPKAAAPPMSRSDFEKLLKQVSNWNRWGADDQRGATNLITAAVRRRALALVRDGECYSMAHDAEFQPGPDNATPVIRKMTSTGVAAPAIGPANTGDSFFMSYHGYAHTHMDSFCHFLYDGKMYNGYSKDLVTEDGAAKNSIINFKNGIMTRGVLMDMARYKNVAYLEPGTPIFPEDLAGWEKMAGVKVRAGDVMIVRTGRFARRAAKGAWSVQQEGLAGLHVSCGPWLHDRDIAVLGGDGAQDVLPSGVEGIQPIHTLCLRAMGVPIFDNLDLELVGREAARRKRWEFLVSAAPAAVPGATGSVLNPIATF